MTNKEVGLTRMRRLASWIQQRDPGLLVPLEAILRPRREVHGPSPMIVIAAPPRSGSTLLYQLLVHSLEVNYISNFHYLLYRLPYTSHYLSRLLLRPYRSNFRSHYGFVPGLNGPAEAGKFWEYWFDQELWERDPKPQSTRLQYILSFFRWLFSETSRPFVAGYIGHALYLHEMRHHFPEIVALCLHRDLLSVAYSLFIGRTKRQGDIQGWWSTFTRSCSGVEGVSPHEQVAAQAFHIDRRLRQQEAQLGMSTLRVDYHTYCANPLEVIEQVRSALCARGFDVQLRRDTQIPRSFTPTIHLPNTDDDARLIAKGLDALRSKEGDDEDSAPPA